MKGMKGDRVSGKRLDLVELEKLADGMERVVRDARDFYIDGKRVTSAQIEPLLRALPKLIEMARAKQESEK